MKKNLFISLVFCCLVIAFADLNAQVVIPNQLGQQLLTGPKSIAGAWVMNHSISEQKEGVDPTFVLNYDAANGSNNFGLVTSNTAYQCGALNQIGFARVDFDSLYDFTTGTTYNPANYFTTIDSVLIPFAHENNSGLPDTITISVINNISGSTLWFDRIITTSSLTGSWLVPALYSKYVGLTLNPGETFAVIVEYSGAFVDTFTTAYGFTNNCGGGCLANNSNFPFSSHFNPTVCAIVGSIDTIFGDCNGNGVYDNNNCEALPYQNFYINAQVTLQDATTSCYPPAYHEALDVTEIDVTLSWTSVPSALQYRWRGRKLNGVWAEGTANDTFRVFLDKLGIGKTYEWQVQSICASGTSSYTSLKQFTTLDFKPYCTSGGLSTASSYIQEICLQGGCNNKGDNNGYRFFNQPVEIRRGKTYPLTVTPGYKSTPQPVYWRIWIDTNRDGDFTDAGELVTDAGGAFTGVINGSLPVPASSDLGITVMRVQMKEGSSAPLSCEVFSDGEVEDYAVKMIKNIGERLTSPFEDIPGTNSEVLNLEVYPTLLQEGSTLSIYTELNTNNTTLDIVDIQGVVVRSIDASGYAPYTLNPVSMDALNPGVYTVILRNSKILGQTKIIVAQ